MRLFPILSYLLLSLAIPCNAQTPPNKDEVLKEEMSIYWDEPLYPALSKERNEQGTVTIRQDYVNGKASGQGTIVTSSRSALLDEAALKAVQAVRLKSKGTESEPETVRLQVDVEFGRDTVTKLDKKPCAELNADIAYFKSTQPGVDLNRMRLYEMTLGMVVVSGSMSDMSRLAKVSKAMPVAFAATASQCERSPDAKYFDVFTKAFKAAF